MEDSSGIVEKHSDAAKKSADKYLGSRDRRILIERKGGKMDAVPSRLVDIIRSRRLAKKLGLTFKNQSELDLLLPHTAEKITGANRILPGPSRFE